MNAVLVNYNFDPKDWWLEYDFDTTVYDRSDDGVHRTFAAKNIFRTPNLGNVDYDKLTYLVENYDHLPDLFLWGKTNLFKYISKQEFDALPKDRFTPLLTQSHPTYFDNFGAVNYYKDGMYYERNAPYFTPWGADVPYKHFKTLSEFLLHFGLARPDYVPFAPGGNYILSRETVHKYSRDFYDEMRRLLPHAQVPAEAFMCERAYYLMWTTV